MDAAGISHPSYELRPGFCRFCNHALNYAWSMTRFINEAIQRAEYTQDSPEARRMEAFDLPGWRLGKAAAMVYSKTEPKTGWPSILICANGACDALTEEVFRQASAIARARADKVRLNQQVRVNAHQIAAQKAARLAANQLAGSLAKDANSWQTHDRKDVRR